MTSGNFDPADFDLDSPILQPAIADSAMTSGNYPYEKRLKRSRYEERLLGLQAELVKVLAWLQQADERLVVLFEGRDAAGKGGTIRVVRQYLNPRPCPDRRPAQAERPGARPMVFPALCGQSSNGRRNVLFDRSWYNRGVVETSHGFCTREQTERSWRKRRILSIC